MCNVRIMQPFLYDEGVSSYLVEMSINIFICHSKKDETY